MFIFILLHKIKMNKCFTAISFAAVKIVKTSQETRNFFRADSFVCLPDFASSLLKYKKFFKFLTRRFNFSKYKRKHKKKLSIILYTSNIVWFSLQKRWKLLSESVFGKIYSYFFVDNKYNKFWFLGLWNLLLKNKYISSWWLESSIF